MKKCQEVGNYVVHVVRDEHLIAVKLYLVLVYRHSLLNLREVEHTGKCERIVYIKVNVEHRIFLHRVEGVVEIDVIFFFQL